MLHIIDTMSVSSVQTTLSQLYTTSMEPFFNVDVTLPQRCFNVASTSVKATSKPISLVENFDLQKMDKFYSNK